MNKKISALLFLLILSVSFAAAQIGDSLEENLEKLEETKENLEDTDTQTEFIKKRWVEVLAKTESGQNLLKISDFIKKFDPLFKIVLGVEYSLTWAFVFSILIWIILYAVISPPTISVFNSTIIGLISSAVITSIIGITGIIRKAVDFLGFIVTNLWIALISLIIAIIIAFVLGKILKKNIKKQKELSKKEQLKRDRTIIHTEAEAAKKDLKSRGGKK